MTVSHQTVPASSQLPSLQRTACEQIGTATSYELPISNPKKPAGVTPITSTGW